jgi:butyryl-CoA dehydrogenase
MNFELDEELKLLQDSTRRLARDSFAPKAAHWDRACEAPLPNLKLLAANGLAGITIAERYGGSGGSILHAVVAVEEIARYCPVTAAFILANCTASEMIQQFGSDAQKERYLPRIAVGEAVGAWAMTEPGAGSAANDMTTRAVPDGGDFLITGTKCFITRAAIAAFYVTFARVGAEPGSKSIAAFLVDRDAPGVRIGARDLHMGLRGGASAEIVYEQCRVPKSAMVVAPGNFARIMKGLNQARVLNPAICLGIAAEALELALAHAKQRKAFGREIASFQGIQWMLADMAVRVEAMRALIYRAASLLANGRPEGPQQAAVAKLYAGENAFEVVDKALQIHGGYGYSSELPLERMLRDVRAFQLGGGTNEILRNRIAAGLLRLAPQPDA